MQPHTHIRRVICTWANPPKLPSHERRPSLVASPPHGWGPEGLTVSPAHARPGSLGPDDQLPPFRWSSAKRSSLPTVSTYRTDNGRTCCSRYSDDTSLGWAWCNDQRRAGEEFSPPDSGAPCKRMRVEPDICAPGKTYEDERLAKIDRPFVSRKDRNSTSCSGQLTPAMALLPAVVRPTETCRG